MSKLQYKLPVSIFKQGRFLVAHSPVLDLSVSGRTKSQVQKRFVEAVEIFFEELEEKGTTDEVLTELGWEKGRAHADKKPSWQPPKLVKDSPQEIEVPALV